MTASLPVPHQPLPDEPDESGVRARDAEIVEIANGSRAGATDAAPRSPAPRPRRPAKPRAPRTRTPKVATDPGPPPPLPPEFDVVEKDIVEIPPKPPLPADVAAAVADADIARRPPPPPLPAAVVADAVRDEEPDAPVAVAEEKVEPDADIETVVEIEPEPDLEPEREVEIEPDAVAVVDVEIEPETDLVPGSELVAEIDVAVQAEAEADAFAAVTAVLADEHGDASVDEDTAALVLRGVTKSFGGTRAVEGIDLTVPAGSFYGLVGPNGAGKTTTLSMIAGLLTPDHGVVRVAGVDAASDPRGAKRLMGVLPDRLRTFDRLTGRQLLYYYGVLRGLPSAVVERRTADLARAFDLTDALGRVVSDYSAGMIKKVMLAGAMIHSPRVLVLDEPFEAVDPVSSAVILDILSAYVAHGGTVILSSHGMELVERVCTRVAVIVAGHVLAEGTIADVRGELTLEQRFIELAGGLSDVEGLEWLHTFSD